MNVVVNGERIDVPAGTTVAALLGTIDAPPAARGVAVAVDSEVVPRSEWDGRVLAEGQQVEVLAAIQGG